MSRGLASRSVRTGSTRCWQLGSLEASYQQVDVMFAGWPGQRVAGPERGATVAVRLPDVPELVVACCGALGAGVTLVPLNRRSKRPRDVGPLPPRRRPGRPGPAGQVRNPSYTGHRAGHLPGGTASCAPHTDIGT